jgi:hypothetical protein
MLRGRLQGTDLKGDSNVFRRRSGRRLIMPATGVQG